MQTLKIVVDIIFGILSIYNVHGYRHKSQFIRMNTQKA